MTSKYTMYGLDWKMWRKLRWLRTNKEQELYDKLITAPEYELHCTGYGNITDGGKAVRQVGGSGLPVIELKNIEGYTLLDWSLIIQNATIIHAVSSSTLYLFEIMDLEAREINLYGRKNGMKDHDHVRPIRTKNYILHA